MDIQEINGLDIERVLFVNGETLVVLKPITIQPVLRAVDVKNLTKAEQQMEADLMNLFGNMFFK